MRNGKLHFRVSDTKMACGLRVTWDDPGNSNAGYLLHLRGRERRLVCARCRINAHGAFFAKCESIDPGLPKYSGLWIKDGEFACFQTWVNKARSWISGRQVACFDSKGRRCRIGKDMQLAHDEGAFPVGFYMLIDRDLAEEESASPAPAVGGAR